MIPSRRLVGLVAVPVVLSLGWVAVPVVLPLVLALDALLVLVAAVDLVRNRGEVHAVRRHGVLQSVGQPFPVTIELHHDAGRALELRVDDDGEGTATGLPVEATVPAGQRVAVTYQRTHHARGRYVFGPITVRWRSPWGLWWRQVRHQLPDEDAVRVYPDFSFLREHGLKARQDEQQAPVRARRRTGGESEFQRLRHYVPGDPYRHIDWKATARRQRFVTREFGQESNQNVIFLIDAGRTMTARLGELTAFDHALNAALAMGHAALRHGDRVGLLVFDRTVRAWLPPRGGRATGTRLLQATYDVFPRLEEPDYAGAFRHLSSTVRRRSLVVLLTSVQDQVNAEAATAVVRAVAGRHLPLCVWLRDPRYDTVLDAPAVDRAAWYHRAAVAELVGWREEALEDWRRRGALVVDAPPARLSAALLSRYLEVKARRLL